MRRKKNILMAALMMAAASLMSCTAIGQEKKNFTITGKASDFADGKKVYLIKSVESEEIPVVDSTVVKDHSFVLEGRVETPYIAVVGVADSLTANEAEIVELFVEPGEIRIGEWKGAHYRTATGTPLNNASMQFSQAMDSLFRSHSSVRPETLYPFIYPYIKENVGNLLGIYLFERYEASMFNDMRLELAGDLYAAHKDEKYADLVSKIEKKMERERQMAELAKTVQPGNPYKNISGESTDGKELSLKSVIERKGNRYVLLEFWATWCGPCMREVPHLKEAYTRFHGKGFEIYSMSIDKEDDKDKWMQTIKEKGMEWTNVLRTDAKNTTEAYGVQGIPANFLIDCSTGQIVATNLRGNALTKKLEELSGQDL